MLIFLVAALFSVILLAIPTAAQLSGSVGPASSTGAKRNLGQCNVLDYGAKADQSTDLGPPLVAAWTACQSGGIVVIPAGNYAMDTWAVLRDGKHIGIQLDGVITRTGEAGGTMISVISTYDFEFFSTTGNGAILGEGYIFHQSGSLSGPRLVRLTSVDSFNIHDIKLVDSPLFHLTLDTCSNGEVYNILIRGGFEGGLDGVDVAATNTWIHDVMVTNKDECVTIKSPSSNILVEQIYCNWSGGCAIGSLGTDTAISNVVYNKVYTIYSNQMMLVKSNGGSGYVEDVLFQNFIGHENAYSLDIDQAWSGQSVASGSGVTLTNLTFKTWRGDEASGTQRGPIQIKCDPDTPCTDITVTDFAMWTDSGSSQYYICANAYGSGACLRAESNGATPSYAITTQTVTSAPAGYSATKMPYDLTTAFGSTVSIPTPTWVASFYPGAAPIKALAG